MNRQKHRQLHVALLLVLKHHIGG